MTTTRISKKALFATMATLGIAAVLFAGISSAQAAKREYTQAQRDAIAQARDLRAAGDIAGAKKVLGDANVVRATHVKHRVPTEEQRAMFQAVKTAVETEDYAAFQASAGTYLTTRVDTEADFAKLVEANQLRKAGDREGAVEIMKELGFKSRLLLNSVHAR